MLTLADDPTEISMKDGSTIYVLSEPEEVVDEWEKYLRGASGPLLKTKSAANFDLWILFSEIEAVS